MVQFNQGGKGSRERRVLEIFRNESSFLLSLDSRASVIYLCRIEDVVSNNQLVLGLF